MSLVISNLRSALRSLVKRPSFAVVALTTIAVGIAANTAIFGVVHAVCFSRSRTKIPAAW